MAERITCPDCKSVLKPAKPVPDGKKVKCPKCGTMFTTPGLVEDDEVARPKNSAKKKDKVAIKKAAAPAPAPKRKSDRDEDEESDGGVYATVQDEVKEDEDKPQIEYAPDMSIKDLRGPAQAAVVSPSNYLLLIGGLCCLCNLFLICVEFWPMVFSESPVDYRKVVEDYYKDKGDKNGAEKVKNYKVRADVKDAELEVVEEAEFKSRVERFIGMGVFLLFLIYNAIAIIGAVKMQNLESRGWGIASSIMTILPMGSAGLSCLIGGIFYKTIGAWVLDEMNIYYSIGLGVLPYILALLVGIWSLRTLMSEEVIEGFQYVAE
jgi:predicted Zn finger-like uncharacterized protein